MASSDGSVGSSESDSKCWAGLGRGRGILQSPPRDPCSSSDAANKKAILEKLDGDAASSSHGICREIERTGRGRGLFSLQSSLLKLKQRDVPLVGPLRPVEDPSPVVLPEDKGDDDFITAFRRLHPGVGRGRAGSGLLNLIPTSTEAVLSPQTVEVETVQTPITSPSEPSELTSSGPGSDIGSEDYTTTERAVVRMQGKHGEKLIVSPNYIRINLIKDTGLFEYHVDIKPETKSFKIKRGILHSLEKSLGRTTNFDGSKLFLPFKLADKVTTLSTFHQAVSLSVPITVRIKYVKEVNADECVHFYNILFRRVMEHLGMVEMKRHFYDYRAIFDLPQHKLEIWPGYVTAVDEFEGGLMLCCDASFRVLRTITVFDVWVNMSNSMDPSKVSKAFQEYALGKIVLTKYNNRHYRIDDITWEENPLSTFDLRGERVSYVEYYQSQYGITIRDLTQPLLINRPKPKQSRNYVTSGPVQLICLIPELCFVSGLSEDLTSNYSVMRDVALFTRLTPQQRHTSLQKFIQKVHECKIARDLLYDWGLEIDSASTTLEGRVIKVPNIVLNEQLEFRPNNFNFSREVVTNNCYDSITIRNWLLVCAQRDHDLAWRMVHTYRSVCQPLGIHYGGDAKVVTIKRHFVEEYRAAILTNLNPQIQFVMAVVQSQRDDVYAAIKRVCCIDRPVPSQVVLSKTIQNERKLRSVMQKIALQINCKLGGSLWTIRIPLPEKIMFIGMDVYHDPRKKAPSATALVASINPIHTKYYSRVTFQYTHQETMSSLKPIFIDAATSFYEENRAWPDRIVVFRDGVSDGQLKITNEHEVVQMTEACQFLCPDKLPKFTFVVVQKRINARILLQKGPKHYSNPDPGTILDHSITRKYLFDFYLVSQLAKDGTVSPTHYIILADNSGISPDMIQKFAFATSFMYYNWSGSIRVPAMCQYAHKMAGLAGQYLKAEPSHQLWMLKWRMMSANLESRNIFESFTDYMR